MTDPGIIFQRTQAGRDEIHQKSHGLTQSERLVLIMVDGVSTYKEIRAKLPVLTDDRFNRALQKLQLKELVLEVFMPLEGQAPDELERTVIDRFLQQDPMDPVTIMVRDPEEELGIVMSATARAMTHSPNPAPAVVTPAPVPAPPTVVAAPPLVSALPVPSPAPTQESAAVTPRGRAVEPAVDAHHAQLADSLAEELRAKRAARVVPPPQLPQDAVHTAKVSLIEERPEIFPFAAVHWGYWLIVSGTSFILGFVLARVTS